VGALQSSSVAGAFFSSQYLGETLWNKGGAAGGPGSRGGGAVSGLTSPEPSTSLSAASNGGGEAVDRLNAKTLEIPPHLDPFAPPFEPGGTFSTATPSDADKDSGGAVVAISNSNRAVRAMKSGHFTWPCDQPPRKSCKTTTVRLDKAKF